VFDLRSQPSDW